jgi:hypothetical protein
VIPTPAFAVPYAAPKPVVRTAGVQEGGGTSEYDGGGAAHGALRVSS